MQFESLVPRDFSTLLYVVIASILAWLGGWFTRRRREPVELAKVSAETRQIHVSTDLSLMQAASEAITKALHLQDRCGLLERKVADLEQKVAQAEDDARVAEMFTDQINMAAKLAGVKLSDYSPRQPRPLK